MRQGHLVSSIQTTFHGGQSLWNRFSDSFYSFMPAKKELAPLDFPSDIDYEQRDYNERDFTKPIKLLAVKMDSTHGTKIT